MHNHKNKNQELNAALNQRQQEGLLSQNTLEIPPKVFVDMQGEMLDYDEAAHSLKARFPMLPRYQNPMGHMQGGVMVALMDNTLGPLSYLVAPPSVTTQINTTYIRPVTPDEAYVYVLAHVTEKTRRFLFMEATATNEAGKTLAMCTASYMILGE